MLGSLLVAVALSSTVFASPITGDYSFFVDTARHMASTSGTHVFAVQPRAQTGPVTLLVVLGLEALGRHAFPIFVGVLGAITLVASSRLDVAGRRSPAVLAIGGSLLVLWWRTFVFQGHPDDALVLTLAAVALLLVRRDRRLAAAVLIGVTLAVKPWAVFLLPMSLRPDDLGTRRMALPAVSIAVGAILWAPFVLSDPATLSGLKPTVRLAPDSVVRLVTGTRFVEAPSWLRILQLVLALAAATWVVLRGRPAFVVLVGVATRMLLDLGTWPYYSVGLVLGALMYDIHESDRTVPVATIAVTALLPLPEWLVVPEVRALLRFVACSGALVAVAFLLHPSRAGAVRVAARRPHVSVTGS